jgi:hypothetical protein
MEEKKRVGDIITEVGKPRLQSSRDALNGHRGGGPPESQHDHPEQAEEGQKVIREGEVWKDWFDFLVEEASQENQQNNAGQSEKEFNGGHKSKTEGGALQ